MNHDVSCRVVIPLLKYVSSHGHNAAHLISGLVEKHYIENPKNWVSRDLVVELFQRCEKIFNDPFIMYKIGMESWNHQKGPYASFIRLLLSPSLIVRFLPKLISMQAKHFKMHAERVKKNQIRFQVSYPDNKVIHRHGCLLNLGLCVSFPKYVWKAKADIVEHECVCSRELESIEKLNEKPKMVRNVNFGSKSCVYLLKWEKIKPNNKAEDFLKSNQEIIENTLDELLKAESYPSGKFEKPNPIYFGSKLEQLKFISPREMQIIKLVSEGMKNKEISQRLFISEETVKKHLNNVYRKMGVKSRVELIAKIYNYKN